MQIATVSGIWRHFASTFSAVQTFNADGTHPDPHTATAALVFNVPEPQVTPEQRAQVKALMMREHYTQ